MPPSPMSFMALINGFWVKFACGNLTPFTSPFKRVAKEGKSPFCFREIRLITKKLGGGNSNMFYFHPENWGR